MKTISSTLCGGRLLYGGTVLLGGNYCTEGRYCLGGNWGEEAWGGEGCCGKDAGPEKPKSPKLKSGLPVPRVGTAGFGGPQELASLLRRGKGKTSAIWRDSRGVRRRALVGRTIFGGRCRRRCHRSGWGRRRFRPGRRRRRRLKAWGRGRGRRKFCRLRRSL